MIQKIDRMLALTGELSRRPFLVSAGGIEWVDDSDWRDQPGDWTGGFWPGILWFAHAATGLPRYADHARRSAERLVPRLEWASHDLGFLFHVSCALGAEVTGDTALRDWAGLAAERMRALLHQSAGLFTLRPPMPGHDSWIAVDTLANLEILVWAARALGREELLSAARDHVNSSLEVLMRPDGSTFHVARLSPAGVADWRGSWQGKSDSSCWSRGQAWAMLGAAAVAAASPHEPWDARWDLLFDFWNSRLPRPASPPWDFDAGPGDPSDNSAAAIAACAFLRHPNPRLRSRGLEWTEWLLTEVGRRESEEVGLLPHTCYHRPRGLGLDCASVWGDFFLLRADAESGGLGGRSMPPACWVSAQSSWPLGPR